MPSIPLPFVVALLLLLVLTRMIGRDGFGNRAFLLFVAVCAVQETVIGFRWGFDAGLARLVQPILAALIPALGWFAFSGLARRAPWTFQQAWPHLLPAALVTILAFVWRDPIDAVLIALFTGYGIAFLWLALQGPDRFDATRIGDAATVQRATLVVGLLLIASGLVDLLVEIDLMTGGGRLALGVVSFGSLISIAIAGYLAAVAGNSRPELEPESAVASLPAPANAVEVDPAQQSAADARVLAAIDALMQTKKLYLDPDLTLDRLARRAGIPARQISVAINRVHGRNISQVVNEYRVAEAKRLLIETGKPATAILFEAGFQTKSNFNREFRRVTGKNPSDFRQEGQARRV